MITPNDPLAVIAFLDKWETVRVGLIEKHRLRAERYQGQPQMQLCYFVARRAQRHYEHELSMLHALRAALATAETREGEP